jgi:hypothetical protein
MSEGAERPKRSSRGMRALTEHRAWAGAGVGDDKWPRWNMGCTTCQRTRHRSACRAALC